MPTGQALKLGNGITQRRLQRANSNTDILLVSLAWQAWSLAPQRDHYQQSNHASFAQGCPNLLCPMLCAEIRSQLSTCLASCEQQRDLRLGC